MTVSETPPLPNYARYIGGQFVSALSGKSTGSENPYTGAAWATVPEAGPEDVNAAVEAARNALEGSWGQMTGRQRSKLMHKLAALLARDADLLGEIETRDNGKPLREMQGRCRSLPEWYEYYAGAADKLHGETIPADKPNYFIYTRREPVGVVAAIVPWNSPLLLMTWKLAPLLAADCTVVVKLADQTPVSALEFARRVAEAGFPPGVFNVVTGGAAVGAALVAHPGVDKVAFTGSTEVGIQVGQAAMGHLAKVAARAVSYSVPFGGFKQSGIGRENSLEGVLDYTDTKTVWIELTGTTRDPFMMG